VTTHSVLMLVIPVLVKHGSSMCKRRVIGRLLQNPFRERTFCRCIGAEMVSLNLQRMHSVVCVDISFLYIRQHNNQTTHFHICINGVYLTYGAATQHVSAVTEPSSGDTVLVYKVIKY
jgi:hypothetical protein